MENPKEKKLDFQDIKPEHSVVIQFHYGLPSLDPLHALENEISNLIELSGVGHYDGHELDIDDKAGYLFMYGPNAEHLYKVVKPVLEKASFMKGASAVLTFKYANDKETNIVLEI